MWLVALAFFFIVVPLAAGYAVANLWAARLVWLGIGTALAYSQSRQEGLGGAWVVVAVIVVAGLLLVSLGHALRRRDERTGSG